jgi:Helicase associated domain
MTAERIELLNSVGFSWSGDSSTPVDVSGMPRPTKPRRGQGKRTPEMEWEHHFQLLLAFKAKHGHVKISAVDDKVRNNQLRDWAAWQRREYKRWKQGGKSHVTSEHVKRLAEIGFCWEVRPLEQTSSNTNNSNDVGAASEPQGNVKECLPKTNTAASTTAAQQGHPLVGRTAIVGAGMPIPAPGAEAPV